MSIFSNILSGIGSIAGNFLSSTKIPGLSGIGDALVQGSSHLRAKEQHEDDLEWQANQAQINRDFQTSEREAAQQFNLDMWNRNNEYNSPEAQRQRLEDAGINVASMNGTPQVASSPVTTSPMPGSQATASSSFASSILTADAQMLQMLANVRKLDSDSDLNRQAYEWNSLTVNERYRELQNINKKYEADINKLYASAGLDNVNKEIQEENLRWLSQKSRTELDLMIANLEKLKNENLGVIIDNTNKEKQGKQIDAQTELISEQQLTEIARRANIERDTLLKFAQTRLTDTQRHKVHSDKVIQEGKAPLEEKLLQKQTNLAAEQTALTVLEVQEAAMEILFYQTTGIPLNSSQGVIDYILFKKGELLPLINILINR